MASGQSERFGTLNLEEIEVKQDELKNINSLKNDKKAVETFKCYLKSINVDNADFFTFTEEELDGHLATFWWNARTQKGEKYKASSLEILRHGLKRALKITDICLTYQIRNQWVSASQ